MAMEFLQGQDLFSLIRKEGPLSSERIARVMIQVCSALGEAHEQNVIHRDLKPENIMVEDRRGQKDFVKVLDFGIAKIQDPGEGQQALTQAGMVCGTPEYMSPEQARGLQLDSRSDIYALGVVMYQLAVGELPFHADTPIGIVTKHILEKPVPPRQRAPHLNVPEEIERIILKAMEKETDKRFATVGEMSDALEAFLAAHGLSTLGSSSSFNQRPVTQSGAPAAHGAEPKKTAPTPQPAGSPTGVAGALAEAVSPPPATSGARVAAISFAVVAVLGVGAVVAAKQLMKPSGGADAGAALVVDAGVAAALVVDAGRPVALGADAGVARAAVDAGVALAVVGDAGTKPAHDPGKNDPGKNPPKRAKGLKAARELWESVHEIAVEGRCEEAMPNLIAATKAAPRFAEPVYDIASCWKRKGNPEVACKAADEYARLKGLSPGMPKYTNTMKVLCPDRVR
jgi:hypothetical protein